MQVVDTDPSDPFDFYIDRYNDQLIAGFSRKPAELRAAGVHARFQ